MLFFHPSAHKCSYITCEQWPHKVNFKFRFLVSISTCRTNVIRCDQHSAYNHSQPVASRFPYFGCHLAVLCSVFTLRFVACITRFESFFFLRLGFLVAGLFEMTCRITNRKIKFSGLKSTLTHAILSVIDIHNQILYR